MDISDPSKICDIVENADRPIVLKNVCQWPLLKWSTEDWLSNLPENEIPFRCSPLTATPGQPTWERNCLTKMMKFKDFFESIKDDNWSYFDYKYMHQWFKSDNEIFKQISWDSFGFVGRNASDSTIWIGSNGAHTPCHQDSYGRNIVVQVFGRKQWMLFPPETDGLKPTRVPYEESSIYSQLNFSSPSNLDIFNGLHGCRTVILEPGDALIVPSKWWHYVENISPIGISINTWIPCEKLDVESLVEEALVRLFVAQICKDLPGKMLPLMLNPNEDDLPDLPLTAAILQVDTTIKKYLEFEAKKTDSKSIKLDAPPKSLDANCSENKECNDYNYNNVHIIKETSKDDLTMILKKKMALNKGRKRKYETQESSSSEEILENDHLACNIINSFCQSAVIKLVKDNLINQYV